MVLKHKEWVETVQRIRSREKTRFGNLRLDKNERVTDFPDRLWKSFIKKLTQEHVIAYPEPERFYAKLARFHGYKPDNFVVTSGSDAAIRNAFDLCVKPGDAVVTLKPTFAMVEVYCELYNAEKRLISFKSDLSLNMESLIKSIDKNVSLVVLANPNSPTGTYIDTSIMRDIAKRSSRFGAILLIDEAYHGFGPGSSISLIKEFENVMVTRTFSKACGLAGLRIGYIIAHKRLSSLLYKFRPMYEANSIALLFAEMILNNWQEVESYLNATKKGRIYLVKELKRLGFPFADTESNFIHVNFGKDKKRAIDIFERSGIEVRSGLAVKGFENFLRITVGPKEAMAKFVKTMENL